MIVGYKKVKRKLVFSSLFFFLFSSLFFINGKFDVLHHPFNHAKMKLELAKANEVYAQKMVQLGRVDHSSYIHTPQERKIIQEWVKDPTPFNSRARAGIEDNNTTLLDTALDKLPSHKGGKLYRNAGSKFKFEKFKAGDIIFDPGYMSTSVSPELVKKFSSKKQFIIVEENHHSGRNISGVGAEKDFSGEAEGDEYNEGEVLFKRGTHFEVTEVEITSNGQYMSLKEVSPPALPSASQFVAPPEVIVKDIRTGEKFVASQEAKQIRRKGLCY